MHSPFWPRGPGAGGTQTPSVASPLPATPIQLPRTPTYPSSRPSTSYTNDSLSYPMASTYASQTPSTSHIYSRSHSRPVATSAYSSASGRKSRAASSIGASEGHQIICAVSEARGISPSVGIAFVNISTGEVVLSQICDNQSYVKTIHKMTVFEPSRILIVSSACPPNPKSSLFATIEEELPGINCVALDRKYWSETAGLDFIQTLAFREDIEAIKVAIQGNFYATCSFSAAMKYLELEFSIRIASHSLRIKYQPSEESMMIDLSTIHSLELIQNIENPKSKACLYGLLNQTVTPMGARMLRSTILQPSTQTDVILSPRYDALDEICSKEDVFFEVRKGLKEFTDVEKLLSQLIILPTKADLRETEQAINQVLLVKKFVLAVPPLFESLGSVRCELLSKIRDHCRPQITCPILDLINASINEDVTFVKSPLDLRNQRVYAVKVQFLDNWHTWCEFLFGANNWQAGVQGLLDVARKTNKEATDDLHQHVEDLNADLGIAGEIRFDNGRKYWLRFRCSEFEDGRIPAALINCIRKKDYLECQTMQIVKLNQRISDSVDEVIMQSDKVIQRLLDAIRLQVPHLFRVCESIALLDMLGAFAHTITSRDYVRPTLKDALALKSARHPIIEAQHPDRFIPNDYYASQETRFQIITGCNMSGKSTYIRTVALLQVMAQIGCFVPAQFASFTIIHNLFSRVSIDDSIEANMSTFSVEMRDMAFILRNINDKSLAIIDELGRGTSTRDGSAIALAIAEALVQSNSFIFFATHFTELASALGTRPGVLNLHLATETTMTEDDLPKMTMLYKVTSGLVQEEEYGIKLARAIGFPERFIDTAVTVTNYLKRQAEVKKQNSQAWKITKRRKLVLTVREMLQQAYDSQMSEATLASYLQRLQAEFIARMEAIELGAPVEDDDGEEEEISRPETSSVILQGDGNGRNHRNQRDNGKRMETAIIIEDNSSDEEENEL